MAERRGARASVGRWRWLLVAALVVVPLEAAGAAPFALAGQSPATGHAEVVAQGVVTLPAARVVWRLVERVAKPRSEAQPGTRVLGYIMATDAPILLTDLTPDGPVNTARLAPGESYLVREGTRQIRSSLNGRAVSYIALELVPAEDGSDVGASKLLAVSAPFSAPPGKRDFDLVGNALGHGERASLPNTDQPALVCATAGAIDIQPSSGTPTRLRAGQFALFQPGPLKITAVPAARQGTTPVPLVTATAAVPNEGGAGYVVGVIGPVIPAAGR